MSHVRADVCDGPLPEVLPTEGEAAGRPGPIGRATGTGTGEYGVELGK